MKSMIKHVLFLGISAFASFVLIHSFALPVLSYYPRLAHMMDRFEYTEVTLIVFLFFSIWLFFLQLNRRKFSTIYLYLVYAVYLFLLFTVLFAKANKYRSYTFDLFDFISRDPRTIAEAVLNVCYFIPLGALYGFKAKAGEFVLIALVTILGVETMQYVFYVGTFAVSDILLNFIGCVIGYGTLRLLMTYYMNE